MSEKVQVYFPEAGYIFKRVYEPKNLMRAPTAEGKTALCAEVCFDSGDEIDKMSEGAVVARVADGLKAFYGLSESEIVDVWSRKVPYAYSVYEIGYLETLRRLAGCLFGVDNLISFGRQGSFRYNHMTNRVMDACSSVHRFLKSGRTKKEFLNRPDPKSDFF
jgi:protoporphyrinogen oxidase